MSSLWRMGRLWRRNHLTDAGGWDLSPGRPTLMVQIAYSSFHLWKAGGWGSGNARIPAALTGFDPVISHPTGKCTGK